MLQAARPESVSCPDVFLTDLVSIPVVILVSRRAVHESRREFSRRDQWGRVRRSSRKPAYNVGNFPRNPSNMGFGIPAPRKTFLDMSAVRDTGGETPLRTSFSSWILTGTFIDKNTLCISTDSFLATRINPQIQVLRSLRPFRNTLGLGSIRARPLCGHTGSLPQPPQFKATDLSPLALSSSLIPPLHDALNYRTRLSHDHPPTILQESVSDFRRTR